MPWRIALALLLSLFAAACSSDADSVCQDIGYCTTESSDQIDACQASAKTLSAESATSGCQGQYAAYFSCADDKYACAGNVPTFTGCEAARAALDACLSAGRSKNACGALAAGLAACPGATTADPSTPLAPCGSAELCAARCYLNEVPELCAPLAAQIEAAVQCAAVCPTFPP